MLIRDSGSLMEIALVEGFSFGNNTLLAFE